MGNHENLIRSEVRDVLRSAAISLPSQAQLGGDGLIPFVKFPFYPTSPWMSTNPNVGYQVRYYSTTLASSDSDFTVNTEVIRSIQFDLPCKIIAWNGGSYPTSWAAPPQINAVDFLISEVNMNLLYKIKLEYTQGDKITTNSRIASNVVGRAGQPGEIGAAGYNVDNGASLQVYLTPLIDDITIDVTLVCLEERAPRNFNLR